MFRATSQNMRTRLIGLLVAVAVLTAGCTGVLLGDEDLVFESGQTTIGNETLEETGYELHSTGTETFNETVSVTDDEGGTQVVVHSHSALYGPESDLPAGVGTVQLGLITTPDATVAGQSVNPLLRFDTRDRVFRFLPEVDDSGLEEYGNYTVEPFGESVTVTVFASETDGGETPDAFVHVMQTPSPDGDDVVLAYATVPGESDEHRTVERLFSAIEHVPAEETSGTDAE